ncbi:hypothetical protein [Cellvibrio sp. QJXJ]|uniref:hypothetical protein n=1 Tax=Cellvibrio sp. QJXJ TaxID=2964606 RepID=UPI0021C2CAA3|nr:hypothetical protein [Cellvibrio sp. QJXJ]UUA71344.1 hypothetical protein NNX04_13085 [Cellvibrio sp. QJXJ]
MALINTDWTKELAQVEATINKVLDEKVEPMVDKALDRSIAEIEIALNKTSFEVQETIKQLSAEMDRQRQLVVADMKGVVTYAATALLIVIVLASTGFTLFKIYCMSREILNEQ